MELIGEALKKAQVSLDESGAGSPRPGTGAQPQTAPAHDPWIPRAVELSAKHLERHRIVSYAMSDPSHIAINLLRTKVRTVLTDNGWKSVGITSPTPGCGKTMIAINLALSLARVGDAKTVLIDFDLRRPGIARTLGVECDGWISQYLLGKAGPQDCFVQVETGLVVGLNRGHLPQSSELLQGSRITELLDFVRSELKPDVVIFDLPPMGGSDDALAFLPNTDAMLLVAAAGHTTVAQIDECERQLAERDKFLGLVLNKSEVRGKEYYY